MIAHKPPGQAAAANHGQCKSTSHFSFYDWDLKYALMTCLSLALLGGLVTTTAVAIIVYLFLTSPPV